MENWKPYKYIWERINGEPFTWTIRRAKAFGPILVIIGTIIGMFLIKHWKVAIPFFIVGFAAGHFWG